MSVAGDAITVTAAPTSTAAQVVAAINARRSAKDLVTASLYRTNTGEGVVAATAASRLDDFLNAPTSQPRGPIEVQGIRIGNDVGRPQGEKIGVFIVCQEHAREWTTPLVCLETAERLVRNYPTDPETKALVDGLDIFIIPSVNPDGATYSMYDFSGQRKNLTNHCTSTRRATTIRRRAPRGASTSTATSRSARSGRATPARRRTARPPTSRARSRTRSPRRATRSTSRRRTRTSSSR